MIQTFLCILIVSWAAVYLIRHYLRRFLLRKVNSASSGGTCMGCAQGCALSVYKTSKCQPRNEISLGMLYRK